MSVEPRPAFWERVANFILRRSRLLLCLTLAVTLFFVPFVLKIRLTTDIRDFHRKDARLLIETIEDGFQEGSYLALIFESRSNRSLLEPDLLKQQFRILQEIKKTYRVTTTSLVDAINEGLLRTKNKSLPEIHSYNDVAEGILALSDRKIIVDLEKVSRHLLSNPEAIGFYERFRIAFAVRQSVAPTGGNLEYDVPEMKAIQAFVQLKSGHTFDEKREVLARISDLAHSLSTQEIRTYAISDHVVSHDMDVATGRSVFFMGLLLVLFNVLFLWGEFKKGSEILLTLSILAAASLWTFGIMALLGIRISCMHTIVLPILLGVGIDNSFVFGNRLSEERAKGLDLASSLRATYAATGQGIFLSTFTTFLAFLISAFTSTAAAIVSFNLAISLSMLTTLILTLLLQGTLRSEAARWNIRRRPALPLPLTRFMDRLYLWIKGANDRFALLGLRCVTKYPRWILRVGLLAFLVSVILIFRIESQADRELYLKRGMPSWEADRVQKKYFGMSRMGYILIEGDIANPLILQKMRELEKNLSTIPELEKVLDRTNVDSINDLIDKMSRRLPPGLSTQEIFERISASEETANYVLNETFAEKSKHLLRKRNGRYDGLVMRFFLNCKAELFPKGVRAVEDAVRRARFDEMPGIRTQVGGGEASYTVEQDYYFKNYIQSFFLAFVIVFIILFATWRSAWKSLAAMVPIAFSAAVTVGLMALCGVKLNAANLFIGTMIVGLGDDYPIHITERYTEEREKGVPPLQAIHNVLTTMGSNIMACTMTSVVGFGAAMILAMPVTESFGIFTALSLFVVFVASIFILPILLMKEAPGKLKQQSP